VRRSIIAAVDTSAGAAAAARVAASLARGLDRRLVLAHVADDPPVFPYGDRWAHAVQQRRATEGASDLLERVASAIEWSAAERRIVFSGALHGSVADRLAALSREENSDLLVLGPRRRNALTRALLGSVSASLMSNAACPVIVVPPDARQGADPSRPLGPIICGVDGSVESIRARHVAEGLADRLGVLMIPIHVEESQRERDASQRRREVGDSSAALAQLASRLQAGFIVVGRRDRKTPLGSVSESLVAEAQAPVLIVPPAVSLPRFTDAAAPELARVA
jgi:nucleotide-binding universal stress UspA family protein